MRLPGFRKRFAKSFICPSSSHGNLSDTATSMIRLLSLCHPKPNHSLHFSEYFFNRAKGIACSNTASSVFSPTAVMNEKPRECSGDPIENEWPERSRRVESLVFSIISRKFLRLGPLMSKSATAASVLCRFDSPSIPAINSENPSRTAAAGASHLHAHRASCTRTRRSHRRTHSDTGP